jgi:phosphate transport system permease protein
MTTGTATGTERAEQVPETADLPEVRRDITGRTVDDRIAPAGAAIGALGLVSLIYDRLLPLSGAFGFVVSWFVTFVLLYALVSAYRHPAPTVTDRIASVLVRTCAVVVGGSLVLVIGYVFYRGEPALWHTNMYTQELTAGPHDGLETGGVLHAVVGTLTQIGIAVCITLPLGVGCAVFMTEVGGRLARLTRTVVEAMTALPSIVCGLFVYIAFLLAFDIQRNGLAASLAISVMMLPIIARSAEVVLRVVPGGLREASLALGASQWQTVRKVVLPTARPALATAMVLGIARGIGETSPVLITAGYTTFLNANPFSGPMVSLPLFAYTLARSPEPLFQTRAFGAAALLMALVLLVFLIARLAAAQRRGRR